MDVVLMGGIPSPPESVWYLGPLPLRAYALSILAGILLASIITIRRYRARGGPEGAFADMLIVAVPVGIIGARIYHVITHYPSYFGAGADPLRALYIWEGGLAIMGAISFGTLAGWLVLRRKGLRLAPMADAIAPALLVAQAVGRLGNYFNQELFGGPTDLPWGLQIEPHILAAHGIDPGTLVHPTFLYEMLWNLSMAALLVILDRRLRLGGGQVFALYVVMYSTGRFWIEGLRMDPALEFLGIRLNAWSALGLAVLGVVLFIILRRRGVHREKSAWLPGREPADGDESTVAAGQRGSTVAAGQGNDSSAEPAAGQESTADVAEGEGSTAEATRSSPGAPAAATDESNGGATDGGAADSDAAGGGETADGVTSIDPTASTVHPDDVDRP